MQQAVAVTVEAASTPALSGTQSEATFESLVVAPALPPLPVVQQAEQQEFTTTEFI